MKIETSIQSKSIKLKTTPEQLYKNRLYWFSRFLPVRKGYSLLQTLRQRFIPPVIKPREHSIFEGFDADECVKTMRKEAIAFGLQLPASMVEEILQYASQNFCMEPGCWRTFLVGEVKNGRLPCGYQPTRALVLLPDGGDGVSDCPAIEQLVEDKILLQIAHDYLGYSPTRITRHLTWMMASEQTIGNPPASKWHFDIAGWNFVTFNTYITPVPNADFGPHVMLKGSHRHKPLPMLLSSEHSEEDLIKTWGKENMLVVTGESGGFGFYEDASCFHRAQPPLKSNRLLLQIRYS